MLLIFLVTAIVSGVLFFWALFVVLPLGSFHNSPVRLAGIEPAVSPASRECSPSELQALSVDIKFD